MANSVVIQKSPSELRLKERVKVLERNLSEQQKIIEQLTQKVNDYADMKLKTQAGTMKALGEVVEFFITKAPEKITFIQLKEKFPCLNKGDYRKELINYLQGKGWYKYFQGTGRCQSTFVRIIQKDRALAVSIFTETPRGHVIKANGGTINNHIIDLVIDIFSDRILTPSVQPAQHQVKKCN